jgi:hypothetical protein
VLAINPDPPEVLRYFKLLTWNFGCMCVVKKLWSAAPTRHQFNVIRQSYTSNTVFTSDYSYQGKCYLSIAEWFIGNFPVINIAPNVYNARQKERLNSLRYKRSVKYTLVRLLYQRILSLVHAITLKLSGNISRLLGMLRKNF